MVVSSGVDDPERVLLSLSANEVNNWFLRQNGSSDKC
jgi:hypothetical protein